MPTNISKPLVNYSLLSFLHSNAGFCYPVSVGLRGPDGFEYGPNERFTCKSVISVIASYELKL